MNRFMKKAAFVAVTGLAVALAGCADYNGNGDATPGHEDVTPAVTTAAQNGGGTMPDWAFVNMPMDASVLEGFLGAMPDSLDGFDNFRASEGALANQLANPSHGDVYAVIHTNHGEIHMRLFPEHAPLAVRNFVTHANNGFFDGLIFHRVMYDFMVQGGCSMGNGMGGESIWGQSFGDEFTTDLRHIRGALSMANSGPATNGSQFFIVHNYARRSVSEADLQYFAQIADIPVEDYFAGQELRPGIMGNNLYMRDLFPIEFMEHYATHGGTDHLDFGHTVFGQVIYGMDVVDAIAAVPVNNTVPVEDVVIHTVELRVWQ